MALFTDIITLYNHLPGDAWQRTVIYGVQWTGSIEKTVTGDGKIVRNAVVNITIPDTAKCEREYISCREFRRLGDHSGNWTLDAAENLDIMILGEVDQEISMEYRLKHLKEDFDCVTVASVADNRDRDLLKHIKVVCI